MLHISGLGVDDDIPQTPYDGIVDLNQISQCVGNLIGLHKFLDLHPVVYYGENDGNLIRNVVPHKASVDSISSHGSKETFGPHVDNPDLPLFNNFIRPSVTSPDTLSLFCVRQDPEVPTDIIFLDDVLSKLDSSIIEVLMMPIFKIIRPDSFSGESQNNIIDRKPVLEKDNYGNYVSRYDAHRVFSDYHVGNQAIQSFAKVSMSEDIVNSVYMKPGDFILFKNKRVLHSRRGFSPRFDGYDRWLIRAFGLYRSPDAKILISNKDLTHLNTDLSAFSEKHSFS